MAADQNGPLVKIPRKISSLLEYQQFFGVGPNPTVDSVTLDSNNNFVSAKLEITYKMYDSVSLFYANGGGDCYIVSAGLFPSSPSAASYNDFITDSTNPTVLSPLSALAKVEEPTLLVFPDNSPALMGEHYKDIYTAALEQCATLQNRFLICDVDYDPTSSDDPGTQFRNDIGINNLSYGAAYIPWLNVVSPKAIAYADFKTKIYVGSTNVSSLANLTTDATIINSVQDLDNLLTDINTVSSSTSAIISSPSTTLGDYYAALKTALQNASNPGTSLKNIFSFVYNIANNLNNFVTGSSALHSSLAGNPATSMLATVQNLIATGSTGLHFSDLYSAVVPYNNLAADTAAEQLASVTLTVTAGAPNDTIGPVSIVNGSSTPLNWTGTITQSGSDNASTLASSLYIALHGVQGTAYVVTQPSATTIKITAAAGTGASGDNNYLHYALSTTTTLSLGIAASPVQFQGGSDAVGVGISGYTTPSAPPQGGGTLSSYWGGSSNPFSITALPSSLFPTGVTSNAQKAAYVVQSIDAYVAQIIQLYSTIQPLAQSKEANAELALTNSFPVLGAIVNGLNSTPISMPPSGAIAGLYAAVDNDRGVWKAPANVSVNNVLGPDSTFNNGQLDELNVDVNAGKSINAIRPFKGKGTLVYGARTLAGNDNNWRYVNVRRFFIMVEQSVKKAIESFVFEPNDANTWNRTKAMVDAFLFQQWRAGALQGSKPDQAYFVKVGLGETMVAQDILEGRMIVSIGMAVVHPAEFIVLQFSQMMPQS